MAKGLLRAIATRRWFGFRRICYFNAALPRTDGNRQARENEHLVKTMDVIAQYQLMLPVALGLIVMWPALRVLSSRGIAGASVVGAAAGSLIVLTYWLSGKTHPNAIAGLLQWNDAAGYLWCATELIAGATLHPGCSMRPYYVAQFGSLLAASGGNVQVALLLQSALLGAASGWFVHLMTREHGVMAGMTAFAALLVYIAQFTLPVLTENAGLLLGLMSLTIIWVRAGSIAPSHFLAAMMILTLALNARAGAMLLLPTLLAWSALWSTGDARQRMIRSLYGLCGIVVAVLLTLGLAQVFGGETAQSHSNFAYTLYALSAGKSTYLQILLDHPEIRTLSTPELSRTIYGLIWDNMRYYPELFALGYIRGGIMWASGLFDFVPSFHLRAIFFVLALSGLWSCLKDWRNEREFLLLVMLVAVAASSPFLFPYGGTRILSATFPIDLLLVLRGTAYVARRPVSVVDLFGHAPFRIHVIIATVVAVAPLLIAPLLRALPVLLPVMAATECPPGQYAFVADLRNESVAVSLSDADRTSLFPLVVNRLWFTERIHPDTHRIDELKGLADGTVLFDVMQRLPAGSELQYGKHIQFLWVGSYPQGLVKGCVDPSPQHWLPVGTSLVPIG